MNSHKQSSISNGRLLVEWRSSMIKQYVLYIFLLVSVATVWATEDSARARKILMNALKQSTSTNFVLQKRNPDVIYYRAHSPNGALLQRYERYNNGRLAEMVIMNEDGMFQMGKNYAIHYKMEDSIIQRMFGPLWNTLSEIRKLDERVRCEYKMKTVLRKSVPCYKITMTAPYDNRSLANFFKMSITSAQLHQRKIIAKYPHIIEFIIGQVDQFIYAIDVYSYTGAKISGLDLGNVKFISTYDPSLFEIPKDKKIEIAKDIKTVIKINKKYSTPKGPSVFSRISQRISYLWDYHLGDLLDWGGKIAFILSIILVALIIILKIKEKKRL